ncbi:Glycosyl transferase family 11 [Pedobacter terrae]|uniref:Glycosyl transferase family 11 n=1 Tax=Pedobacter terrae TaxID=405671 RepID=A0A1G7U558_9SPHI|nr:alpha-1,2-fucosyltransferase [Pedobacter terrae]SDG42189.1 Glycosyl transferase family 11 [Pedobacter terrae]
MIIINDKPGQLCNQLWSYAPFIASSLEHQNTFVTLYFEDNFYLFENLNRFENIKFGWFRKGKIDVYFRKVLLRYIRVIPDGVLKIFNIHVDKVNWKAENWGDNLINKKNSIVFLGAGCHKKNNLFLTKYHSEIIQIFEPKKIYKQKVDHEFSEKLKKFDTVVGVHIRRGDYKNFLDGIYYFDNKVYLKAIETIKNQLAKKVVFLLCSNEKLDLSFYSNFDIFQISEPNSISDLYALSCCNYIIGPPSTYSMWASYYGKVPLKFIKHPEEPINLKDFSEIVAQDTFANGNLLIHDATS